MNWIRRSGSTYTMNVVPQRNLGKSVIVVGITATLSQLLSVGYLVFLARWIGPQSYALHVAIFNICSISAFLVNWGLDTWLLKKTSDNQQTSSSALKTVLLLKMGFGVFWGILLFFIAPILKPEIFLRNLLLLAILSTLFESLTNSIYTVFLTTDRFKQSSTILLLARLFRFFSLVGLYFLSINKLVTIITVRTLIDFLVLLIAGLIIGLRFNNWKQVPGEFMRTFLESVPFHASDLINIVFHQIDVTLVTFLSTSLTTISSYSLMISFFNVINTIVMSIMNVVVPSLSKYQNQSLNTRRRAIAGSVFGFFVLGLAGWAAVSILGQSMIYAILGDQYAMAAELISRTAVIIVINSLNVGLAAILIVHNRQKNRIVPQIVSLVLKMLASLLLFPMYQTEGLRWIYIFSEVALSLGYLLITLGIMKDLSATGVVNRKRGSKLNIVLMTFNQEGKGTYLRAFFLGKELIKLGHKVTILAASADRNSQNKRVEDGLLIVTFSGLFKEVFLSGWGLVELMRRIFWLRSKEFDLVHAFECRPTTYFPARILQKQGSAFFTDWADWLGKGGSVEERPNGIIKSILKLFETFFENRRFKYSDGITAICSILADECIKRGYPQKKVLLLPNGLRNTYLQSLPIELARAEKGLPQKDLIIGYLGSGFEKDMELMYSSFRALKKEIESVKLLHIGRSNYLAKPDADIIFTGPVSYDDISVFLSACDVFWFPLRRTQANFGRMPLKFSDYLTVGRPIVSTEVGDLAEWITSLQVGLVGMDTPESLTKMVLEATRTSEQKRRMGVNAIQASEKHEFSWNKRAQELDGFYYSHLNGIGDVDGYGENEM